MKRLLLNIALICSVFPIYAMEHGKDNRDPWKTVHVKRKKDDEAYKHMLQRVAASYNEKHHSEKSSSIDWIPGKSVAGILPFRRTSNGVEVLVSNGRNGYTMEPNTNRGGFLTWSILTGRSQENESPKETALREGSEEMAFALDDPENIINEYERVLDTAQVAQRSWTYQKLKEALDKTSIPPFKITSGNDRYGSSFLYPIDFTDLYPLVITDIVDPIIIGHHKNDAQFFAYSTSKNAWNKLYIWNETDQMKWLNWMPSNTCGLRNLRYKF